MANEEIQAIGFGVEISDTGQSLEYIRSLRQEAVALVQALESSGRQATALYNRTGGRGMAGGPGGPGSISQHQQEQLGQQRLFGEQQLSLFASIEEKRVGVVRNTGKRILREHNDFYTAEERAAKAHAAKMEKLIVQKDPFQNPKNQVMSLPETTRNAQTYSQGYYDNLARQEAEKREAAEKKAARELKNRVQRADPFQNPKGGNRSFAQAAVDLQKAETESYVRNTEVNAARIAAANEKFAKAFRKADIFFNRPNTPLGQAGANLPAYTEPSVYRPSITRAGGEVPMTAAEIAELNRRRNAPIFSSVDEARRAAPPKVSTRPDPVIDEGKTSYGNTGRTRAAVYGDASKVIDQLDAKLTQLDRKLRTVENSKNLALDARAEAGRLRGEIGHITTIVGRLNKEIDNPRGARRGFSEIAKAAQNTGEVFRTVNADAQKLLRTMDKVESNGGSIGGGPTAISAKRLAPQGLNEKGFFSSTDMIARISRNILLYQVVAGATYGLQNYIATAFEAARVASQTAMDMQSAAESSQNSVNSLFNYAEGLRNATNLSREQARQAVTEAAYFTEDDPGSTKQLIDAIANIGASRGYNAQQRAELAEQLRRQESKQYKRFVGSTVEELYKAQAAREVDADLDIRQPGGATPEERRRNNLTRDERISRRLSSYTEQQKQIIAYNAVIAKGSTLTGALDTYQKSLAGQLDRTTSRWADAKEAVGEFILQLQPLQVLLKGTADLLERVAGTKVTLGTGPNGIITQEDIQRSGRERANSVLARTNNFIENYGAPIAGLGGTLLASGLLGRKSATDKRRIDTYNQQYDVFKAGGVSDNEARRLAAEVAREQKGGMVRSVKTGLGKIWGVLSSVVIEAGTYIGAELIAQRAMRNGGGTASAAIARQAATTGATTAAGVGFTAGGAAAGGAAVAGGITAGGLLAAGGAAVGVLAAAGALFSLGKAASAFVAGKSPLQSISEDIGVLGETLDALLLGTSFQKLREIEAEQRAFEERARTRREDLASGRGGFQFRGQGEILSGPQANDLINRLNQQAGTNAFNLGDLTDARQDDATWNSKLNLDSLRNQAKADAQRVREEREKDERERDERKRAERVQQQNQALQKLRETSFGSFRLIGETAEALADDNPYVKIFSDGATAAERMAQQWSFLGEKIEQQQLQYELTKIHIQGMRVAMEEFVQVQDLGNRAARERNQREGPGLNRRETERVAIQEAMINRAIEIPQLWAKAAAVLGEQVNPMQTLITQLRNLQAETGLGAAGIPETAIGRFGATSYSTNDNRLLSGPKTTTLIGRDGKRYESSLDARQADQYAAYLRNRSEFQGLGQEAQNQVSQQYANSVIGLIEGSGLKPDQIRKAGLGGIYIGALRTRAQGLTQRVEDERRKAIYAAREDEMLAQNLKDAIPKGEELRRRAVERGVDPDRASREATALVDKYIIGRTDGIDPKDLTSNQFAQRQEALQREAQRTLDREMLAYEATQKGLALQDAILQEVAALRKAILEGDVSVLVQVSNDTEARVDQEALEESNGAGYQVGLKGGRQTNPYVDSFTQFPRGGGSTVR